MRNGRALVMGALCASTLWLGWSSHSAAHEVREEHVPFRYAMAIAVAFQDLKETMGSEKKFRDKGGFASFFRAHFEFAYYTERPGGIQVEFRAHGAGTMGGTARYLIEAGAYVIMKREFDR